MPLNVIIKSRPVDWRAVHKELEGRQNERINRFNKEGWKIASRLVAEGAKQFKDGKSPIGDKLLSVPVQLDGLLMDDCRRCEGHSDWRRSKSYLTRLAKQPEMSVLPTHYQRGLDIMKETADK